MQKLLIALMSILALVISSPASAGGETDCNCTKPATLRTTPPTTITWVDIDAQKALQSCPIFEKMAHGQTVEGSCGSFYVRCTRSHENGGGLCQARKVVQMVPDIVVVERGRAVQERTVVREVPIVRERTVVRHFVDRGADRYVRRDRHSGGGSWRAIPHRSTMNCWGRGRIRRGQTVYGHCNGRYTRCTGGSLDSGAHRSCSARL